VPRLLALSHSRHDPSSRFRVMQLLPWFEQHGWRCDHRPIRPSLYWQPRFPGTAAERWERRAAELTRRAHSAWVHGRAGRYDAILVNRELPYNAPLLFARNRRVIFDFDDALYLGEGREHIAWMCRQAACTVVGNEELAAAARSWARRLVVIPTLIDTERYEVQTEVCPASEPRVLWLGSPYSIDQTLRPHLDLLARIQQRVDFRLVVISRPRPRLEHPTLRWDYLEWSPKREAEIARHGDIGIMPLQDTPYQRAKCGAKILQYMAAGLPSICSSPGVNRAMMEQSGAGFLADTPAQWEEALTLLCADPHLRRRLASNGRRYCEERFSIRAWLPVWLDLLAEVAGGAS